MHEQAELDAMLNSIPMTDEWLDLCAEAYMSELMKWGTQINRDSEKPFEVYRRDNDGGFNFTHGYLTEQESGEAYEKLTHRAAAMQFLFTYNALTSK
jgi:hypothetical protein